MTDLILHYAPDNASLCVRLALEAAGADYDTRLVDRAARAQRSDAYRALNPNGLIPVLETPDGSLFETAAILLWLAERFPILLPSRREDRASAKKWLIWMGNTLHPTLRMRFYPSQYIDAPFEDALARRTRARLHDQLAVLDVAAREARWIGLDRPLVTDCYLCPLLRWVQLYPAGQANYPSLSNYPALSAIARTSEGFAATLAAARAEGLGAAPFALPHYADPPEGSAT